METIVNFYLRLQFSPSDKPDNFPSSTNQRLVFSSYYVRTSALGLLLFVMIIDVTPCIVQCKCGCLEQMFTLSSLNHVFPCILWRKCGYLEQMCVTFVHICLSVLYQKAVLGTHFHTFPELFKPYSYNYVHTLTCIWKHTIMVA